MPRNTREWALRKLQMALGNMGTAAGHLYEVVQIYKEPHPEIAEPLTIAIDILAENHTIISKVQESI